MVISNDDRVELIWLLTRLLCYVPRPEDVTDDKRGFVEYHPRMLEAVSGRARERINKLQMMGVTVETDVSIPRSVESQLREHYERQMMDVGTGRATREAVHQIVDLNLAVQQAADCLTSGLGMVSGQAYAKRTDGCLAVLASAGADLDHSPPTYNPYDEQVAEIKEMRGVLTAISVVIAERPDGVRVDRYAAWAKLVAGLALYRQPWPAKPQEDTNGE